MAKSVHVRPESVFTILQNRCSRSPRKGVHVAPEYASMDFDIEKPDVPSPVAYRSMHDWQRLCVKRSGQCSPPKGSAPAVRKERDLRAAMRMEARLDGMTNVSELLINIVNQVEPKLLTGSGQNGTWQVIPL